MDDVTGGDENAFMAELRRSIDELDGEIVRLWRRRAAASSALADLRVAAGGTRLSMAQEYEIVARYREALGADGGSLAVLLLRAARK